MKKSITFLIFALLLAGCARETVPGTNYTESLRAMIENSRAEVDGLGKFSWTAGDLIAVHRSASGYETATLTEEGLFNVHLADGEERNSFAVYPAGIADESHNSASDLSVILPNAYTIPVDGMGEYSPVPMIAQNKPESEDLLFHHLGGILRVTLNHVPYEAQKIYVNLGKRVTGSFSVENPTSNYPSISLDNGTAEDIVYTTENPVTSTTDGFNLNIPLPKGTYNGATVKIYDRYDNLVCEQTVTVDFQIGRAQGLRGDIDMTIDVRFIPLCMKMARQGTVTVTNPLGLTMEYSLDNETWTSFNSNLSLDLDRGDQVYFRGNNAAYSNSPSNSTQILSSAKSYIFGNIMSLINPDPDVFSTLTELTAPYTFCNLFHDDEGNPIAPIICGHPSIDLILPATTLTDYCYYQMFRMTGIERMELPATQMKPSCYEQMFEYCTRITEAPELPATELAESCYKELFSRCSGIKVAPELPATTLAKECYYNMFENCSSLTSAPDLPSTSLEEKCYQYMFQNCISLTTAPELPAMTMAPYCYQGMFEGCESLTSEGLVLPATTLATYCYYSMFRKCSSLTVTPALPAMTLADRCYERMFEDCISLVTVSEWPATTLASDCYDGMFRNCTSLVNVPEVLPATTLAGSCYSNMFQGCTSLETAPVLPALEFPFVGNNCYSNMFKDCTSLKYVKAMFVSTIDYSNTLSNWLLNVSTTGTYVMNAAATYNAYTDAGVPTGWTIDTAIE